MRLTSSDTVKKVEGLWNHINNKEPKFFMATMMMRSKAFATTTVLQVHVPRAMLILRNKQTITRIGGVTVRNQNTRGIGSCAFSSAKIYKFHDNDGNSNTSNNNISQGLSQGSQQHRYFSDTRSKESKVPPISSSFPSSSLPLFESMIEPHLDTIQQLPEIQHALEHMHRPSLSIIEGLKRGLDIFSQINAGGEEHCAVLALLADCHCRLGQYSQAQHALKDLQKHRPKSFDVNHSKAKAEWYLGHFTESSHTTVNHTFRSEGILFDPLKMSAAQNSMGLTCVFLTGKERINDPVEILELTCHGLLEKLNSPEITETEKDDKDQDEDGKILTPEQKAAVTHLTDTVLETLDLNMPMGDETQEVDEIKLAMAIGFNNLGIALILSPQPEGEPMAAWREGLNILDKMKTQTILANAIRVRLLLNMANLLLKDETESSLKTASEYAKGALRLSENSTGVDPREHQFMLGRSLSVVASCFVRADAAVTAEGLFQSSLDALQKGLGPLNRLTLKDTYNKYAMLCHKWDKRKSDAERLERDRDTIELPNGWRGQPEIVAGFVFFGPGDF